MKKTVVLGASSNPLRYAYTAVQQLERNGHSVAAVGNKEGHIGEVAIQTGTPVIKEVDTITLYLNPQRQKDYYDYIFSLSPKRIIFNPGTENPELVQLAHQKGIETEIACTLVLLSIGAY